MEEDSCPDDVIDALGVKGAVFGRESLLTLPTGEEIAFNTIGVAGIVLGFVTSVLELGFVATTGEFDRAGLCGDSGACDESSSTDETLPCAWLWWYFSPLACLYFLLQSCSGHSSSTGEMAQGVVNVLAFFTEICTGLPVTGLVTLCVLLEPFTELAVLLLPFG